MSCHPESILAQAMVHSTSFVVVPLDVLTARFLDKNSPLFLLPPSMYCISFEHVVQSAIQWASPNASRLMLIHQPSFGML